jgi:hypothetical protein
MILFLRSIVNLYIVMAEDKESLACFSRKWFRTFSIKFIFTKDLNDLKRTRLSRGRMIWLLPHTLRPSPVMKGIDGPFGGGVESILIRSLLLNWRLGYFLSYFKGQPSQDLQKTCRRRLITFKVTLTGQSHFTLIFVLRKVTLRSHINSVLWMYAVTPTPYYECKQFVDSIKSL